MFSRRVLSSRAVASIAVVLATLVLMLATESHLAPVWDEGFTLIRLPRVRAWIRAMYDPGSVALRWHPEQLGPPLEDTIRPPMAHEINTRTKLLTAPTISWFWPFAREEPHGHPPFYALVALLGDVLSPSRDELARARLGPILVFSATVGGLFCFVCRYRGPWPAVAAAGAFALHPQLFALGHYAHYDGLLTCFWTGSILTFALAVLPSLEAESSPMRGYQPRWGWVLAFGILVGCAAGTKLTGWFLPVPFLVWTALYRDRRGLTALVVGGTVAALTLWATTPPWWTTPISGAITFLQSNLTRADTHPIPVKFLGETYLTPIESLPWYNTLAWTVMATPLGILGLALAGVLTTTRRLGERLEVLAVINLVFLLILRALPHTPGHDGVRQFLPAFGILALVAGLGTAHLVNRFGNWGRSAVVLALIEGALSIALMMPVPLSYFSPICGGLPGAVWLGMEPTYYWDALTDDAQGWINRHTARGRTIRFSAVTHQYFYLHSSSRLNPEALFLPLFGGVDGYIVRNRPWSWYELDRRLIARFGPRRVISAMGNVPVRWAFTPEDIAAAMSDWQWYIVQNRPGFLTESDHHLITRFGSERVVAAKWGVPLIWAFSREDVAAVIE
jgi:Dolichyl-phosphate-mannose-protein mannosyltransferase